MPNYRVVIVVQVVMSSESVIGQLKEYATLNCNLEDPDYSCITLLPVFDRMHIVKAEVRVDGETDQWFNTNRGTRQGDPISPTLFKADLERAMDRNKERQSGITVHGIRIHNSRFGDDVDLPEEKREELKHSLRIVYEEANK